MSVPRRVLRLVLPFCALALLASIDADASIRDDLDELMGLVEAGEVDADDVTMSKRRVTYGSVQIDVHGAQERKQVRYARLRLLLSGDRQAVYRALGWPTHRRLESYAGATTELWHYDGKSLTYVFEDGMLTGTRIRSVRSHPAPAYPVHTVPLR